MGVLKQPRYRFAPTLALILALALLLSACSGGESATGSGEANPEALNTEASNADALNEVESYTVAGYRLTLFETTSGCQLHFESSSEAGELTTALTPPCRFILEPDRMEPQTVSYEDAGGVTVAIIVGTPEPGADATGAADYCGTQSQGVLMRESGVTLSARVGQGRKCTVGEDESEFNLFAH